MSTIYDRFHANKSERLRSFEDTVKNIFDEKLKIFGDCFGEAKSPLNVTHVQIFYRDGTYYFRKIHRSLKQTLAWFDEENRNSKRYILYRSVSMKNTIAARKIVYCVMVMRLTNILNI